MEKGIRIPVFNHEHLFQIYKEWKIDKDEPDLAWIDPNWKPEFIADRSKKEIWSYDTVAEKELFRVLKFRTCPFCRTKMDTIYPVHNLGIIHVCKNCFYWAGRGGRLSGPSNARGNMGVMSIVSNPEEVKLELLINHLNQNINRLYDLTPRQAEKIMPDILKDYLKCEVKGIGGVKDKGVDALAIRGEKEKILVQIKWREQKNASEGVAVVREVGGTLLARGIPKAMIITTRKKFSNEAVKEGKLIEAKEISNVGKLGIELKDFNDLIDMFEVSALVKTENLRAEDIILNYDDGLEMFGSNIG